MVDEPTSAEWVIGEWVTLDRELHPFETLAWRAPGLLPIAMVVQCTRSIAPGPGRISDFRNRLLRQPVA